MIVVESWQHGQAAGIHGDSVRPGRGEDRFVVPQRYNPLSRRRQGTSPRSRGIERDDIRVVKNQIRRHDRST
jgi:hypothetical protein